MAQSSGFLLGERGLEASSAGVSRRPQERAARMNRQRPIVEALALQLRSGVSALREPSALRRISEINEAEARNIADRLTRWRWSVLALNAPRVNRLPHPGEPGTIPPWEQGQIQLFVDAWKIAHGRKS
jgi:hypothetical protein